ncbi:MAG: hypothetical protein JO256_03190 [Alphaproteobacteria bacterium]|nr:hypothetical protein [Alphaproteobacteria bacterium]
MPTNKTAVQVNTDLNSKLTEVTVASASTCNIGTAASPKVEISGTTTINSLGTSTNCRRTVRFSGASLTLTHNATSLILPGGANIVTAAGDTAEFHSDGSGNWRCVRYTRAHGGAAIFTGVTGSGNDVGSNSPTFTGTTTFPGATVVGSSGRVGILGAVNSGAGINIVGSGIFANAGESNTAFAGNPTDNIAFTGPSGYWCFRSDTSHNLIVGMYNSGTEAKAVQIAQSGLVTILALAAGGAAGSPGGAAGTHSLRTTSGSVWVSISESTTSGTPLGHAIYYSGAAPNGTSSEFLYCIDNSAARAAIRSNGGLANYSANNVNLSDITVKPQFERYSSDELDRLEAAFISVDWGKFKYHDQTHDDWNYGYSAQGAASAFANVNPGLVDVWNPTERVLVGKDDDGNPVFEERNTPIERQLKGVYETDLNNIGNALLARALKRVSVLEAEVAALKAVA